MRQVPFVLTALGLFLGTLALDGHAAQKRPKKDTTEALMKKKLAQSQKVLEGIALHDLDKVAQGARELLSISKQAEFRVFKTPLYEVHSKDFRASAEDLIAAAKKKNVEAAALAYVELTLTCVRCHRHVREKRMALD